MHLAQSTPNLNQRRKGSEWTQVLSWDATTLKLRSMPVCGSISVKSPGFRRITLIIACDVWCHHRSLRSAQAAKYIAQQMSMHLARIPSNLKQNVVTLKNEGHACMWTHCVKNLACRLAMNHIDQLQCQHEQTKNSPCTWHRFHQNKIQSLAKEAMSEHQFWL